MNICYGRQNNGIIEMIILSTLKICLIEKKGKIIFNYARIYANNQGSLVGSVRYT